MECQISFPIIPQIFLFVPSMLSFDHTGHMSHQVTLNIAAIFDNGNKLISV